MAKIHIYLLALVVWILFFHFAGLIEGTGTSYVLNNLGVTNPENFGTTQFYAIISGISILALAGISIGLVFGRNSEIILLTTTISLALLFLLILWDFIALFNVLRLTNHFLAIMIISPLMIIFILTIYEWVRGMST